MIEINGNKFEAADEVEINFAEGNDDTVTFSEDLPPVEEVVECHMGFVKAKLLNLRANPNGEVIKVLEEGDAVMASASFDKNDWARVTTVNGDEGFVKAEFVDWT